MNSGYSVDIIEGILGQANSLERNLSPRADSVSNSNIHTIRWVILSGTFYEQRISNFVKRLNTTLSKDHIKIEVIKSTGACLGQLLFNNKEKYDIPRRCSSANCNICLKNLRPESKEVVCKLNGRKYHIDINLNCNNCGIYKVSCPCTAYYTGKTTTLFS